jgi:hypothetical protein
MINQYQSITLIIWVISSIYFLTLCLFVPITNIFSFIPAILSFVFLIVFYPISFLNHSDSWENNKKRIKKLFYKNNTRSKMVTTGFVQILDGILLVFTLGKYNFNILFKYHLWCLNNQYKDYELNENRKETI